MWCHRSRMIACCELHEPKNIFDMQYESFYIRDKYSHLAICLHLRGCGRVTGWKLHLWPIHFMFISTKWRVQRWRSTFCFSSELFLFRFSSRGEKKLSVFWVKAWKIGREEKSAERGERRRCWKEVFVNKREGEKELFTSSHPWYRPTFTFSYYQSSPRCYRLNRYIVECLVSKSAGWVKTQHFTHNFSLSLLWHWWQIN